MYGTLRRPHNCILKYRSLPRPSVLPFTVLSSKLLRLLAFSHSCSMFCRACHPQRRVKKRDNWKIVYPPKSCITDRMLPPSVLQVSGLLNTSPAIRLFLTGGLVRGSCPVLQAKPSPELVLLMLKKHLFSHSRGRSLKQESNLLPTDSESVALPK